MKMTDLKIGDSIPYEKPRGILGAPLAEPRWHALKVAPLRETAAALILKREGVRAFFPREPRERVRRGKRFTVKHPTVTQIVYAKFKHEPNWDVLQARRVITGVFCVGTTPIDLPVDVIRVLQKLPTEAERLQMAKEALRKLNPGDQVRIADGPFADFFVDVTEARDGRVWWQYIAGNGFPVRGECDRDEVVKLDIAE